MESWTIDLLEKKKIILKVLYYTHTQKCLHKDTKNNLLFWCYLAFFFFFFKFIEPYTSFDHSHHSWSSYALDDYINCFI